MFSVGRFVSYIAAGIICVGTYLVFAADPATRMPSPLVIAMVGYAVVGAVAVGFAGARIASALAILWATAVVLVTALVGGTAPLNGDIFPVLIGALYGSLAFIVWMTAGGAIWRLLHGVEGRRSAVG